MDIEGYGEKIDNLLVKEKIARQENSHTESVAIVKEILITAYKHASFENFIELLIALSKKRGQAKKALIEMVAFGMKCVEEQEMANKMKLVETLKGICDKKIFLEVEYARCVLLLVKHKEDAENINEAAKILQEVQVETYGSMEKREKIEFILYQMKIMLKKSDYVRLAIISKKLNLKHLEDPTLHDLKSVFFHYLVVLHLHEKAFKEVYVAYKALYDTVKSGFSGELPPQLNFSFAMDADTLLENLVYYLAISEHNNGKIECLKELLASYQSEIEGRNKLHFIVKMLLSNELIPTDLSTYNLQDSGPFNPSLQNQSLHFQLLRKQLIRHNLRVLANFYSQISLFRIQQLINVSADEVEDELCELLVKKDIKGKIDRVDGFVKFGEKKSEKAILNDWVTNLNSIFSLIDSSCNLIKRENEIMA